MGNKLFFFFLLFPVLSAQNEPVWGFFAHRKINYVAVFTLPPPLLSFYKDNLTFITEEAVTPDRRRHSVKEEAPRHFIDLDLYGDSAVYTLPRKWEDLIRIYSRDTLSEYGILPWHIASQAEQLTKAFRERDYSRILRLSADLGHYIGDAHVPLHTTSNYNGQKTNQQGIHAFWESRLPELFYAQYDLVTGRAEYMDDISEAVWAAIRESNNAVDSVLAFERQLSDQFPADNKFSFEERGNSVQRTYSVAYSEAYNKMLGAQVEKRFRKAVKLTGNIWYTCWVNAGQPVLETANLAAPEKSQGSESESCTH